MTIESPVAFKLMEIKQQQMKVCSEAQRPICPDPYPHGPPTHVGRISEFISVCLRDFLDFKGLLMNTMALAYSELQTSQLVIIQECKKYCNWWKHKISQEVKRETPWNLDTWTHKGLASVRGASATRLEGWVAISQVNGEIGIPGRGDGVCRGHSEDGRGPRGAAGGGLTGWSRECQREGWELGPEGRQWPHPERPWKPY